jgi:hypothetical protein
MPFTTKFTVSAALVIAKQPPSTICEEPIMPIESYLLKLKHVNFPLNDIGVFSVCKVKYLA